VSRLFLVRRQALPRRPSREGKPLSQGAARTSFSRSPARLGGALLAALVVVGGGCATATFEHGRFEDAVVRYRIEEPKDGWVRIGFEQANVAFFHRGLNASLLVNSHCQGVADAPLEALSEQLLFGMTERVVVEEQRLMQSHREGLQRIVSAKLDGVQRSLATFVEKKDGCVYDLVLDAPPSSFDEALPAFVRAREGLRIEPRKDHEAAS